MTALRCWWRRWRQDRRDLHALWVREVARRDQAAAAHRAGRGTGDPVRQCLAMNAPVRDLDRYAASQDVLTRAFGPEAS